MTCDARLAARMPMAFLNLGIRQQENSVCYEKVVVEPKCMHLIPMAEGHITTLAGVISVKYDENQIHVSVPEKTEAVLRLDGKEYDLQSGKETVPV